MSHFSALAALFAALLGLAALTPASAHHSYAMFDRSQTVKVTGTLKQLQWTNPHVFFWIYVDNGKGANDLWAIEGENPEILRRHGWDRRMVKPGDKVTLELYPLKDGRTGGYFNKLTAPDGRVWTSDGNL